MTAAGASVNGVAELASPAGAIRGANPCRSSTALPIFTLKWRNGDTICTPIPRPRSRSAAPRTRWPSSSKSFGIAVERDIAKTGIIGSLKGSRPGGRAIALRADMDALPIEERNHFAHASQHQGRMHACGHDGHTAMLLGAARYLAETRNFTGTIHFIFQPAEENEGGARLMVEEGLLERYPFEAVYGMHNWPGLPAGQFAIRPGAMMAAFDIFEIAITGRGAHAAMPHLGIDPVVAAAQVINALQTITSRNTHPLEGAVVSV